MWKLGLEFEYPSNGNVGSGTALAISYNEALTYPYSNLNYQNLGS